MTRFSIDPETFTSSAFPCVEPDPRNPERSFIRAENCLAAAFGARTAPQDYPIVELLAELEAALLAACSKTKIGFPDQDHLSMAQYQWCELMIAVTLWNANAASLNTESSCWIRLPRARELKLTDMFDETTKAIVKTIEDRSGNRNATLLPLNPNFICTYIPRSAALHHEFAGALNNYSRETYQAVTQAYRLLMGHCAYEKIRMYLSLQSFSEPDKARIPHEANLLKAMHAFLQREVGHGEHDPCYYAFTLFEPSIAEQESFRIPASHSLIDENTPLKPAVDGLLRLRTLSDVSELLLRVL